MMISSYLSNNDTRSRTTVFVVFQVRRQSDLIPILIHGDGYDD